MKQVYVTFYHRENLTGPFWAVCEEHENGRLFFAVTTAFYKGGEPVDEQFPEEEYSILIED